MKFFPALQLFNHDAAKFIPLVAHPQSSPQVCINGK